MDINFNIGFGKIDSLSWDSSLLKIQFSNGEVMVYENITFTEYQQLLSCLTAADKPSIEAIFNELEMYELKETLWNVNVAIKGFLCKFQKRINRNIVECK